MRYQGKITDWKDEQGFGFITPNAGGQRVFAHINSFWNRRRRPSVSELVTYELSTDTKGRCRANKVRFVDEPMPQPPFMGSKARLLVLIGFAAFLISLINAGRLPSSVLIFVGGASAVAFIAYALDKSAARRGSWRTPELHLHILALIGGWPGALAAQQLLHHKSKKQSFQSKFWLTVIANCASLVWLVSTHVGARVLSAFASQATGWL